MGGVDRSCPSWTGGSDSRTGHNRASGSKSRITRLPLRATQNLEDQVKKEGGNELSRGL